MTYDENRRAFMRTQLEGRLLDAVPRAILRSRTYDEDIDALLTFVEAECARAVAESRRESDALTMTAEEWSKREREAGVF